MHAYVKVIKCDNKKIGNRPAQT